MRLIKLELTRGYFNEEPLRGSVQFLGDKGDAVTIRLDEEVSQEIVTVCADAIVKAGKQVAEMMVAEVIEQSAGIAELEHKPKEEEQDDDEGEFVKDFNTD